MQFNVGDRIRFLNEVGEGVITKIVSSKVVIAKCQDGFENQYTTDEIVLAVSQEEYKLEGLEHVESVIEKINSENKIKQDEIFYKKFNHLSKIGNPEEIEIDLHIEELIDSHRGMSNAQILSVQMSNFQRELNVAIRKKAKKLIVIHGVGEGTLRAEIRNELHLHYPEFEFHDASYRKYGYGATEIILR